MEEKIKQLKKLSQQKKKENKKLLAHLKKQKKQRKIDELFHDTHHKVFENINCLTCANCCKTTGPLFTQKDISRISSHLKMKEVDFLEKYLKIDEDNDYVLQKLPCSFLGVDNFCSIYDYKPKACREFPHTDRVKQSQLFNLTIKNSEICPAVYDLLETIKNKVHSSSK